MGGGLEWAFLNNLSAKVEYLYYDMGSETVLMVGPPPPAVQFATRADFALRGHIVRAGLNWHFNLFGPGPVVAKY